MEKTIFLIACFLMLNIHLQAQEPPRHEFRWKEVHRLNSEQYKVKFDDTMVIHTHDGVKFSLLRNGLLVRAEAKEGKLDFVYNRFKVIKNEPEEIILYEPPYYHIFHRDLVNMEHADAPSRMAAMKAPEQSVLDFSTLGFEGHWRPYKKERVPGMAELPKEEFMRDLIIGNDSLQLFLWDDPTNEPSFGYCEIKGGHLVFSDKNQEKQRILEIRKAEGNEIILADELGMIYFLRKFR